jgi:hypothetical protein
MYPNYGHSSGPKRLRCYALQQRDFHGTASIRDTAAEHSNSLPARVDKRNRIVNRHGASRHYATG